MYGNVLTYGHLKNVIWQILIMGQTIRGKVFKNGLSKMWKIAIKEFKVIWSASADQITSNFLKAVYHKFYLGHS